MMSSSHIELGFLERCESWQVESRLFPSKVGGKPAWLSLKPVPTEEDLKCTLCQQMMIFLCQVYAPYTYQEYSNKNCVENNFHRTIFIFVCRNAACNKHNSNDNIRVYRSNLKRENDFYSANPPEEKPDLSFDLSKWSNLCNLCGVSANNKCGKCKNVFYCCRKHQIIDWKNGHKTECTSGINSQIRANFNCRVLFEEWLLETETEELAKETANEKEELEEFEKLKAEGKIGVLADIPESDLEAHASSEKDKVFAKFKKRIAEYPDQVLRYNRGGKPLLISEESQPNDIPNCELCNGTREFEFQIMPQMLSILKETILDWGVLLIYTCKNSCIGDSINTYKKEFVWKQDVSLNKDL